MAFLLKFNGKALFFYILKPEQNQSQPMKSQL